MHIFLHFCLFLFRVCFIYQTAMKNNFQNAKVIMILVSVNPIGLGMSRMKDLHYRYPSVLCVISEIDIFWFPYWPNPNGILFESFDIFGICQSIRADPSSVNEITPRYDDIFWSENMTDMIFFNLLWLKTWTGCYQHSHTNLSSLSCLNEFEEM